MRIAVNTRLLLPGRLEGIGWFAHETLRRITKNHPEHQFIFIFDRPFDPDFLYGPNVEGIVCSPPARHPLLFYIWFEWRLPALLKKIKADVFLSPDGYLSLRSELTQVAVIHDINFEHSPLDIPLAARLHFRHFFPKYAEKAKRIATVSAYSKSDIADTYNQSESKIDVVYNGVNTAFHPISELEIVTVRKKYSHGEPYFLFVGAIHPRKNLLNQLIAFALFRQRQSEVFRFLIVGEATIHDKAIADFLANNPFRHEIHFLGRQPVETLVDLYGAAVALLFVSKFEGFGIPILEAFKSGIPVITSTTSSMPEIAGGAALLVDWENEIEIAQAIYTLATEEKTRSKCIDAGLKRVEDFSWDKSAKLLYTCLNEAMLDKSPD